jgi:hypothetical protein
MHPRLAYLLDNGTQSRYARKLNVPEREMGTGNCDSIS